MSVDFTTIIGYGYMLSWDEAVKLTCKKEELWDYFYNTNCYCDPSHCAYFFGITMKELPCGDFANIKTYLTGNIIEEAKLNFIKLLKDYDLKWEVEPQVFVINRIH